MRKKGLYSNTVNSHNPPQFFFQNYGGLLRKSGALKGYTLILVHYTDTGNSGRL